MYFTLPRCTTRPTHVIRHQVPEVEDLVHLGDPQDVDLLGATRRGHRELVLPRLLALGLGELGQTRTELVQERDVRLRVGRGLGVLVVDVKAGVS